ncbi:MAG: hypothetical protein MRZ79_00945 [Bacteroidia bacterium]|nr:hypothetical protein [Bacteroidia bacterium]
MIRPPPSKRKYVLEIIYSKVKNLSTRAKADDQEPLRRYLKINSLITAPSIITAKAIRMKNSHEMGKNSGLRGTGAWLSRIIKTPHANVPIMTLAKMIAVIFILFFLALPIFLSKKKSFPIRKDFLYTL